MGVKRAVCKQCGEERLHRSNGEVCAECIIRNKHAADKRRSSKDEAKQSLAKIKPRNLGADIRTQIRGAAKEDENAQIELYRRDLCRRKLLPLIMRFHPDYQAGWFHRELCERLERFIQAVLDKESPRLILTVPPRHGKSTIVSQFLPAWFLGNNPALEVMVTSYSASLAMGFSRKIRGLLRDPDFQAIFPEAILSPDSQSAEHWNTTVGGGLLAAGVGGSLTGFGSHVLIIDDPVKNRSEAESATTREAIMDWYSSTAYTRLAPGGGVLQIMTRWHHEDLAGQLIQKMEDDDGDSWEVVNYPAISTQNERFRKEGQALHPDRYDEEALARIKRAVGPRDWIALYQQTPTSPDGEYFKKDMIKRFVDLPAETLKIYTLWDLAVSQKQENDFSVGIVVGVASDSRIYVLEMVRGKWNSMELVEEILNLYVRFKPEIVGIEKGQIEISIGPFLRQRIKERELYSMFVKPMPHGNRDKMSRARSIQGRMQQGMVLFPRDANWFPIVLDELIKFPSAKHDDTVDALAYVGLLLDEMISPTVFKPKKKKSWRDTLKQFVKGGSSKSAMSA